jgi:hypothetical protein
MRRQPLSAGPEVQWYLHRRAIPWYWLRVRLQGRYILEQWSLRCVRATQHLVTGDCVIRHACHSRACAQNRWLAHSKWAAQSLLWRLRQNNRWMNWNMLSNPFCRLGVKYNGLAATTRPTFCVHNLCWPQVKQRHRGCSMHTVNRSHRCTTLAVLKHCFASLHSTSCMYCKACMLR